VFVCVCVCVCVCVRTRTSLFFSLYGDPSYFCMSCSSPPPLFFLKPRTLSNTNHEVGVVGVTDADAGCARDVVELAAGDIVADIEACSSCCVCARGECVCLLVFVLTCIVHVCWSAQMGLCGLEV